MTGKSKPFRSKPTRRAGLSSIPAAIRNFLKRLVYPLYYLDFETFQSAVPLFDEVRPYQQVPFQFSLHVVAAPGAAPGHDSYLSEGRGRSAAGVPGPASRAGSATRARSSATTRPSSGALWKRPWRSSPNIGPGGRRRRSGSSTCSSLSGRSPITIPTSSAARR